MKKLTKKQKLARAEDFKNYVLNEAGPYLERYDYHDFVVTWKASGRRVTITAQDTFTGYGLITFYDYVNGNMLRVATVDDDEVESICILMPDEEKIRDLREREEKLYPNKLEEKHHE